MSYLDLLNDDCIEFILNFITDNIENNINIFTKKINKLNKKIKLLDIFYYDDGYYTIDYDNVYYGINKYLFSNFNKNTLSSIILINKYNEYFSDAYGVTFISNQLHNPTYLDILIEANKSIIITRNYVHTKLIDLYNIPNNELYDYIGIRPKKNIKYYVFILNC